MELTEVAKPGGPEMEEFSMTRVPFQDVAARYSGLAGHRPARHNAASEKNA
ncbi:hypothetical protein [Parvibaculum sp.]|uniref:hypothetical protein n=1 Tax=Parvibaculum sp. TaxID=2024848 RepID=UPI001B20E0DF|nr:hypothetical protein [Parvibaculum sp.]MBO6669616.1 hypothetical protein [Parvibaculum sp.]MBO6693595.1 hypothetical protein [Parvibaculum sp.]MBO6716086.1 hypothetical protein [Parvibaculum sp.]